jgi:hypothetical protein
MYEEKDRLKEATLRILDELPRERIAEVFDFALFVKEREAKKGMTVHRPIVQVMPAAQLDALVGLVAWGGDAVADTERLYDNHG